MSSIRAKVTQAGQVNLPAAFRKAVGLEHGGRVIIELSGKEIRIRAVDEIIDRAQDLTRQLLGGQPTATVDGFLADRQREARSE